MRFSRLDLLKFGRFDGASIELPSSATDLHIVYGDNEAGKSTTLEALECLLFGFPTQTSYNFKFKNPDLRIGATLHSSLGELELIRRKGKSNTLISADGTPLVDGEKRLAAMLGAADQAFYRRSFLLDDKRLRQGAGELLESAGDAGDTLLASGAGINGLITILRGYDEQADALWGKTSKASREFAKAKVLLKAARDDLKDAETNASSYKKLKGEFKNAQTRYDEARSEMRVLQLRQTKLSRIRRVHFDAQLLHTTEQDIAAIGDVPELPTDATSSFAAAEKGLLHGLNKREFHLEQQSKLAAAIKDVNVDKSLLQRAGEVDALSEARLVVLSGRRDLPALQQTALALEEQLAGLARDLGWSAFDPETAAELVVPVPVVDDARMLAQEIATASGRQETARRSLDDATVQLNGLKAVESEVNDETDSAALRAALLAANAESEVSGRREKAEETSELAQQRVASLLAELSPVVADAEILRAMAVPTRGELDAHQEIDLKLATRVDDASDALLRAKRSLAENEQKQARVGQSLGALSDLELVALREERDTALGMVLRRYVQDEEFETTDWQAVFGADTKGDKLATGLVSQTDKAADARLANADEVASTNLLITQIDAGRSKVRLLEQDLQTAKAARSALAGTWQSLWAASGVTPATVDQMIRWIEQRDAVLQRLAELEDANLQLERYRSKEAGVVAALSGVLASFKSHELLPAGGESLSAVRAQATEILAQLDTAQDQRQGRAVALVKAQAQFDQARVASEQVSSDAEARAARWSETLERLQLSDDVTADKIEPYLRLIEQYRARVDEASALRLQRIGKINTDTDAFETQAKALAEALAPDLLPKPADELTLALAARKEEESLKSHLLERNAGEQAVAQQALDQLDQDAQAHKEALADLHGLARTTDLGALKLVIERSESLRTFELGLAEIKGRLQAQGDGKSIAELLEEVMGMDLDEVSAEEQQIASELPGLDDGLTELRDQAMAAKALFDDIGSSGDAAAAAGRVQSVFADMETIAESFVRARASEKLLSWGIDHFRKLKQGPLLDKASGLFRTATGGAYTQLVVDYDGDSPVLAGVDQDGAQKKVDAMSDGTRDQLYLALRLAAVEDYIERAEPMPFVADDVFVHFDDARTGYALKALEDLSTRCQVVVFTHHKRLVEIAEDVLTVKPNVVRL